MKGNAYSALAPHYEKLVSNCDYEQWSQYLFEKLNLYAKGKVGCDCACGSGYFTRFLKKSGYDVYGVDSSDSMLTQAKRLAVEEQTPVNFILQDVKKFKSFKKLDFITVINDGLNYLDQKGVASALKSFYTALKKDGVLLFDVSSEYKLKEVVGNNLFGEDTDDVTYMWFNECDGKSVKMDLTFFVRQGETYLRQDESHVQYIHGKDQLVESLEKVGFEVVEVTGLYGEPLKDDSQRIHFIAIKR